MIRITAYRTTLLLLLCFFTVYSLRAQSDKDRWRCRHVVRGLKMSKALEEKFTPVFYAYLKELHEAKDIYDDVKDRYRNAIDKRQLTPTQAQELLDSHWKSDEQEVKVRKKYTLLFSQIVKKPYVYYIFQLANDKVPK